MDQQNQQELDETATPRPFSRRWGDGTFSSIPDLRVAAGGRRSSRSRREVLALIGADAARRAVDAFRAQETAARPGVDGTDPGRG